MKTEYQTLKLREKNHCQMRKNQLYTIFQSKRQLITVQLQKKDEQQFATIYPTIDQSNFSFFLPQIKRWSCSQKFSYKMVSLMGYLYEYLLINVDDNSMSILEALSVFEEIQIPQTQQLAIILVSQISIRARNTMTIIANLLNNERYSQYLRNYLLNLGLFQQCHRYFQRLTPIDYQEINLLFLNICCSFITSLPLIGLNHFDSIVEDLSLKSKGNEELVFWAINQISKNFQPNYEIAYSIEKHLFWLCQQKYSTYEQEVIKFFHYCCNSQKQLTTAAIKLIIRSLDKCKQSISNEFLLIITMILKIQNSEIFQQIVSTMEELNFVSTVIDKYEISSSQIKLKCLQILQIIVNVLLKNIINTQKQMTKSILYLFQDISLILADSLQQPASLLQRQGLFLFLSILTLIYDQEPFYGKCFKQTFSKFKVIDLLQNLPVPIDPKTNNLIIHITAIYELI